MDNNDVKQKALEQVAQTPDKSFLDRLKDAFAKETSGPNLIDQLRNNPEFLKQSYDKQMSAPYAALRSVIGKAQEGDVIGALKSPFTGGANVENAPQWSDIAEKAGIHSPAGLAAVQTAGDVFGSQVGGTPGVVGSIRPIDKGVKEVEGQLIQKLTPIEKYRKMRSAFGAENAPLQEDLANKIVKETNRISGQEETLGPKLDYSRFNRLRNRQ